NGVDVDCKIDGTPMIYYALDSKASLDFMVSKGADINALDKSGNTLMHKALKSREAGKVIKYLHDKGLDINAVDRNNETPLMLAVIMYDYYKNSCDDESAEANAYRLRQIIGVLRELGAVSALEKLPIVQENLEKNALKAESSAIGNTLQGFVSAEKGVAKKPTEKPGDSNRFAYWWL
nr:hypothetical protein [Rickettsiaceae bacterium]